MEVLNRHTEEEILSFICNKNNCDILLQDKGLLIIKVKTFANEYFQKYPYRFAYLDSNNVWKFSDYISDSFDKIFLYHLLEDGVIELEELLTIFQRIKK